MSVVIGAKEFFKGIKAIFRSGTKEFTATISLVGDKIKINFNGINELTEVKLLSEWFAKYAQNYDSVSIIYHNYDIMIHYIIIEINISYNIS